jgi:hypothetical protein
MRRQSRRRRGLRLRRRGPALRIEAVFEGGTRPHYSDLVDQLLKEHRAEIEAGLKRGLKYKLEVRHDPWCPALTEGGCCNCNCVVDLIETGDPASP